MELRAGVEIPSNFVGRCVSEALVPPSVVRVDESIEADLPLALRPLLKLADDPVQVLTRLVRQQLSSRNSESVSYTTNGLVLKDTQARK